MEPMRIPRAEVRQYLIDNGVPESTVKHVYNLQAKLFNERRASVKNSLPANRKAK